MPRRTSPSSSFLPHRRQPILRNHRRGRRKDLVIEDIMCGGRGHGGPSACFRSAGPMENGVVKKWDDMQHSLGLHLLRGSSRSILEAGRSCSPELPMNPSGTESRCARCRCSSGPNSAASPWGPSRPCLPLYAQTKLSKSLPGTAGGGEGLQESAGREPGLQLGRRRGDFGDGVTHIVPGYESVGPEPLHAVLDVAGRDVTRSLVALLVRRGYALNRTADFGIVC